MIKSEWKHLFALTPKQKEVAKYLLNQTEINIKLWIKELNITYNNLQKYLYILKDKYNASDNKELLEKIKLLGVEIS